MKRYSAYAIVACSILASAGLCAWLRHTQPQPVSEKPLVVVAASYNNAQWCEQHLASIFAQQYANYRVIYIDDCSTDGTADLVASYVKKNGQEHRFTLVRNTLRQGTMANVYHAVHTCADSEIVLVVDGDDRLKHERVFARLNEAYQNPRVWLTYGQFERYPSGQKGYCAHMPPNVVSFNAYRRFQWLSSHLRTFYAGLFKQIKQEDLMVDGKFFPATADMAIMFPMLEMAAGRVAFIPDVLYVWNEASDINDYKVRLPLVLQCEHVIRHRTPYNALGEMVWS